MCVCAVAGLGRPMGLSVCPGACEQCVNYHAIQINEKWKPLRSMLQRAFEYAVACPKYFFQRSKIIASCNSTA